MKALLSIFMLTLLLSCSSIQYEKSAEIRDNYDESISLSFIIDKRYYARLSKENGEYYLSIPELIIKDLRLKRYTTKEGNPVFASSKENINIKLYKDVLFFSYGSYHGYLKYYETGKRIGDYYNFL